MTALSLPRLTRLCLLAGALAISAASCKATPNYLERWANRDGSEQMFSEHLLNPEASHEVHVKALELLVRQWDYSAPMLRSGQTVRDMSDPAERDRTIIDMVAAIRPFYDEGGPLQIKIRDAFFHIRQATDNPQARAALETVINDWLTNHWVPCQESGAVSLRDLFDAVGRDAAVPHIVRTLQSGINAQPGEGVSTAFANIYCMTQQIRSVTWLSEVPEVVSGYTSYWDSGKLPDSQQQRFSFLEQSSFLGPSPAFRTWAFSQIATPTTDPLYSNLLLDLIAANRAESDVEGYLSLLNSESTIRWSGLEAVIQMRGSEGLHTALQRLPASGEYGYWEGGVSADGFKRATDYVCAVGRDPDAGVAARLVELGDNARGVFEQHINSPNPWVRVLAIRCLNRYGNAHSAELLDAVKSSLGRPPVPVERWGEGATLQAIIDESIAAIRAR